MYDIIITSHGKLASGLNNTVEMILGNSKGVYTVEFTSEDVTEDLEKRLTEIIENIDEKKDVLVLADLRSGTPSNIAAKKMLEGKKKIRVIAGVNLGMIIEAIMMKNGSIDESVSTIVDSAKASIVEIVPVVSNDEHE